MKLYFIKIAAGLLFILFALSSCGVEPGGIIESESAVKNIEATEATEITETTETTEITEDTEDVKDTEVEEAEVAAAEVAEIKKYEEILDAYSEISLVEWGDEKAEDALDNFLDRINKIAKTNALQEESAYQLQSSAYELYGVDLGYALHDLNGDGISELIVLSEDFFVHGIYSLYNSETPIFVGGYWSRNRCVIDGTGTLYIHGSNGAADGTSASYVLAQNTAELQLVELIGMESYDAETGEDLEPPRYYQIDKDGNRIIIDEAEFFTSLENFPDSYPENITQNAGFEFTPLRTTVKNY